MESIFTIAIFTVPYLITIAIRKNTNISYNPYSVIVLCWSILLLSSTILSDSVNLYPVTIKCIIIVALFVYTIGIVSFLISYYAHRKYGDSFLDTRVQLEDNNRALGIMATFSFFLWVIGNALYFFDLNSLIPLSSLSNEIWRWKYYVLNGYIDDNSIRYLGRNLNIIGLFLSLNYRNKKSRLSLLMVVLYLAVTFINPRKDPVISSLIYVLVPLIGVGNTENKRMLKYVVPTALVFLAVATFTMQELSFGEVDWKRSLALYTYGSFNSLSKALDYGIPNSSNLFLSNTFYFIYAILKFVDPRLTPPNIILPSLGEDTSNIYTAIIPVVMDSENNLELFLVLMLYGVFIGGLIGGSIYCLGRYKNVEAFILYCCVFSCAFRSFYNPTFSYTDVTFALIYILAIEIVKKYILKFRITI